jgi:hypothetical protein
VNFLPQLWSDAILKTFNTSTLAAHIINEGWYQNVPIDEDGGDIMVSPGRQACMFGNWVAP